MEEQTLDLFRLDQVGLFLGGLTFIVVLLGFNSLFFGLIASPVSVFSYSVVRGINQLLALEE